MLMVEKPPLDGKMLGMAYYCFTHIKTKPKLSSSEPGLCFGTAWPQQLSWGRYMGMGQYLLIPFLVG